VTKRVSAVDLFCGAGGLTCGLESAGVSVEAGVDRDGACAYPYKRNNEAEFHQHDLKEVARDSPEDIAELFDDDAEFKLLAGCPPCQPFSTLTNGEDSAEHESYSLLNAFGRLVQYIEPDYVVMENVHGVYHSEIYQHFEENVRDWGYHLNFRPDRSVYCPGFGIPQTRRRWVTLAARDHIPDIGPPRITRERDYPTVEDAIGHLPPIEAGQTHDSDPLHAARELDPVNVERVKQSKPGGTWRDWDEGLRLDCHTKESGQSFDSVYGRMEADKPAPTITTQFYNLGSGRFGHYDTEQNRALSLREGALIQTFPGGDDRYEFFEELDDIGIRKTGVLIGNAVPPKLGEVIGERILELIEGGGQSMLADF
jgi:DNA (cytosine-5)-methyltransferase 1